MGSLNIVQSMRRWGGKLKPQKSKVADASVPADGVAEAEESVPHVDRTSESLLARLRSKSVWLPAATGVTALALGIGMGGATLQSEVDDLRVTEEVLTANVAELKLAEEVAVEKLDGAVEERSAVDAKLKERDAELKSLRGETDGLRARIAELETQLEEAQNLQAQAEAEAAAAQANAPAAFAAPPPAASSNGGSAYFKNCTAAREAGAAPVYQGQPGYGSHLDRDGDGVGCE